MGRAYFSDNISLNIARGTGETRENRRYRTTCLEFSSMSYTPRARIFSSSSLFLVLSFSLLSMLCRKFRVQMEVDLWRGCMLIGKYGVCASYTYVHRKVWIIVVKTFNGIFCSDWCLGITNRCKKESNSDYFTPSLFEIGVDHYLVSLLMTMILFYWIIVIRVEKNLQLR